MPILIIAPEQIAVSPPVGGSVEHSIYQIAKGISSKHQVTIISRLCRENLVGDPQQEN
ncbi:hypothetical protein GQF01_25065 [Paenibacillus sp. 5J-6]|uniref:Uncharacterized protein n=1 Tax=Paenibacillus silvestris TaxID=2606219 RepID=A0A6L8V5A3_9BACL|nr:hypothetical protein [Paenibacillus silvestris]MZQ85394.1 hypothetical protein [Paenibacillus silvestris]